MIGETFSTARIIVQPMHIMINVLCVLQLARHQVPRTAPIHASKTAFATPDSSGILPLFTVSLSRNVDAWTKRAIIMDVSNLVLSLLLFILSRISIFIAADTHWKNENCTIFSQCQNGTISSQSTACSENATCVVEDSEYQCKCNPGFDGTGEVCQDIDECLDPTVCHENTGHGTCVNTIGKDSVVSLFI
jgi:hypothetical protein